MFPTYLILLFLSTAVLLTYYLWLFRGLKGANIPSLNEEQAVSIVICARNEESNLRRNLPLVLNQNHPKFEVIVVNDASWDGSGEYLSEIKNAYPNLGIVNITHEQKRSEGKKMALTLGFKKACYDLLLLTDADCRPKSTNWLKRMTKLESKQINLGYGAYEKSKGLLNTMVRFDTWSIAVLYLSAAVRGKAYMGVGRNISYTREIYNEVGGFKSHYHLASGDDDLFVNQASRTANVQVITHPESHTVSSAPQSWKSWFHQKRRHLGVGKEYSRRSKWLIGSYQISMLVFYTTLMWCSAMEGAWIIALGVYSIKTLIHLLISIYPSRELEEKDLLVLLPILEPLMLLLNLFFGIATLTRRTKAWK